MRRFRPNAAAVAAKVIDGEAIIMNLMNGAYYSMDKAGAALWEMIESGCTVDQLQHGIEARYFVESEQARADIDRLVAQLLSEQLIVPAAEQAASASPPAPATSPPAVYEPPVLNKYTEMADLLALDPPMPAIGDLPSGSERS